MTPEREPAHAAMSFRPPGAGIIVFAVVMALLYLGRVVLIPLTVALMLSLLIAPWIRALRRIGLGRVPSVLVAVFALTLICTAAATVLGTQVLRMASSLPQYEKTIEQKLQSVDEITLGRFKALTGVAGRLVHAHRVNGSPSPGTGPVPGSESSEAMSPIPVEVHQPPPDSLELIGRALASVWPTFEATAIILLVMVFVLLEHEGIRDRFILIAGASNIRLTTLALNDAGERLSRYFVSQFTVNIGVGVAVGVGLSAVGVPQPMLWGALAALLRFIPYVGVWIAAILSTIVAIAVAPDWWLAAGTIGVFMVVELVASEAIEPFLYGHATGLSPLSVVVSAIFWGALWGPVGLLLSTPLTLGLLIIGRHVEGLGFLELALGVAQALTLPQRFYQRALSGDAGEIIAVARGFLEHDSFPAYCDAVLMPALHLAFLDRHMGAISQAQEAKLREVVVAVVSALAGDKPRHPGRPRSSSVLAGASSGRILRAQREGVLGKWQGPLAVQPGSMMLCIGLASASDILAAELLVRALRERKLDARHLSLQDLEAAPPPGADNAAVGIVYLMSAFAGPERERHDTVAKQLRQRFPRASLVSVFLPGIPGQGRSPVAMPDMGYTVTSFVDAVAVALRPSEGIPVIAPSVADATGQ